MDEIFGKEKGIFSFESSSIYLWRVNYIFVGTDRYTCSNDLRVRRTVSGHVAAGTRSERVKREGSSLSESGRVPWTRNYASPYLPLQRVLRWIFFELANLSLHPLISLFAPYVYSSFSAIDFAMETFFLFTKRYAVERSTMSNVPFLLSFRISLLLKFKKR